MGETNVEPHVIENVLHELNNQIQEKKEFDTAAILKALNKAKLEETPWTKK